MTTSNKESATHVTPAVNRCLKSRNDEREADFISVMTWGYLAETLIPYAGKGSLFSVDGEFRTRKYEEDDHTSYVTEVLCHSFQLLESRTQHVMRENNVANDLADLVLEEEELPP